MSFKCCVAFKLWNATSFSVRLVQIVVVYHWQRGFRKISLEDKWYRKLPKQGTSLKVVPSSPLECTTRKFMFHFLKPIFYTNFSLGRRFSVNGTVKRFPNGISPVSPSNEIVDNQQLRIWATCSYKKRKPCTQTESAEHSRFNTDLVKRSSLPDNRQLRPQKKSFLCVKRNFVG